MTGIDGGGSGKSVGGVEDPGVAWFVGGGQRGLRGHERRRRAPGGVSCARNGVRVSVRRR